MLEVMEFYDSWTSTHFQIPWWFWPAARWRHGRSTVPKRSAGRFRV